ncbi:MAG: ACP phosphodiesterase, partial [Bacteroidota bacterium]
MAHIYLSGDDLPLMIGNFIADFVKGKEYDRFPPDVQEGIQLHRSIDHYTDTHSIVMASKERLRSKYRHYAGVITDIYYDHFLAKNWSIFHPEALEPFTLSFYGHMDAHRSELPDKVNYVLYHMKRDNWLFHYRTLDGIGKALHGISRRTKFDSKMDESIQDLEA